MIARSGTASRREAERLIVGGYVDVNGVNVTQLGSQVTESDRISIRGKRIHHTRRIYLAINKPRGYICSNSSGKFPSFLKLIPKAYRRVHHVGRLDVCSEGLLLAISDGALTHIITHPKFEVPKFYRVSVKSALPADFEARCLRGEVVNGEHLRFEKVRVKSISRKKTELFIKLIGGKNREIRRLISALNLDVKRLIRVGIGGLKVSSIPQCKWRIIHPNEVEDLYEYDHSHM